MSEFLKEGNKFSATRLVLLLGMIAVLMLTSAMTFHLAWNTVNGTVIEWSGLTMFISGLSALVGTLLYGKIKQKSIEIESDK